MKNMKKTKNRKIVLKVSMKKLTFKMVELINNKCIKFQKEYTHYTIRQHQKPTKNPSRPVLSNFLAKKNKAMVFQALPKDMKGWKYLWFLSIGNLPQFPGDRSLTDHIVL